MNGSIDEPRGQVSDRHLLREVSPEALQEILEAHRKWVESDGKEGEKADLSCHDLRGQNLREVNLQRAELWRANLQGVDLYKTDLSEANLEEAILKETKLQDTKLRGAKLQDVDLRDTNGLLGEQMGGANASKARLPHDIHQFDGLATVEEASRNARKLFFSMLLGCVYSWLAVATTTDVRLITNSASSPLPIIQTPIPIVGFYWAAPLLLLCVYLYFHLYLQRLWERLAKLPAVFPDGRAVDEKAYPWLLIGLVRAHSARLRDNHPPMSRIQGMISILLAWWLVPATILLFWGRYLTRHEWVGTAFHIGLLVVSVGLAITFYRLSIATIRGQKIEPFIWKKAFKDMRFNAALGIGIVFSFVSVGAIYGPPYFVVRADFSEADVSTKPPNWTGREKREIALVKGARLEGKNLRYVNAFKAFLVNADLRFADLRGADFWGADLRASELRHANLQDADLWGADLKESKLIEADLQGANLAAADLQGADLVLANLEEAQLAAANLHGAELAGAELQGANLRGAKGLIPSQVKGARNWKLAFYSGDFLEKLGLPTDHNKRVQQRLTELEKGSKATAAQPLTLQPKSVTLR